MSDLDIVHVIQEFKFSSAAFAREIVRLRAELVRLRGEDCGLVHFAWIKQLEQEQAEDRAAIREAPIDHDYMGGGRSGCSPACIGCTWEQKHAPAITRAQEGKS